MVSKDGRSRTLCSWVGATLLSREHVPVRQSIQRESNPRVHRGKVAGCRYIMDALGTVQVAAATSYRTRTGSSTLRAWR